MTGRNKYVLEQKFTMTFTQEADCCSTEEQYLTIKTEDGGGGDFYVIETERWAFDDVPELVNILMEFYAKHKSLLKCTQK